jgi:hypothetical protein
VWLGAIWSAGLVRSNAGGAYALIREALHASGDITIHSRRSAVRPGGRLITAVTGLHRDTELTLPVGRRADDGPELSMIARESDEAIMGADVVN